MIEVDASTSDAVSRHYDELDALYRRIWGDHLHHGFWVRGDESQPAAVRLLVDLVAGELGLSAGERILDVGSGYGAAARQVALDYGANVTAVTVSARQHAYAVQQPAPHADVSYVLSDWLENDLPSGHFDAAYAIESASHMSDLQRFIGEVRRVLRPGGRFVLCVWAAAEEPTHRQVRTLLEPICRDGRLRCLPAVSEYVDALEKAGFVVQDFQDLTRRVRPTWTFALRNTLREVIAHPRLAFPLFRRESEQRTFLATMLRIAAAYRVSAMRYGLLRATRPETGRTPANLA